MSVTRDGEKGGAPDSLHRENPPAADRTTTLELPGLDPQAQRDLLEDLGLRTSGASAFEHVQAERVSGGFSDATKLLVSVPVDNNIRRFLIRVHRGDNPSDTARKEYETATALSGTCADYFARPMRLAAPTLRHVVAYRYTDDDAGDTMKPLAQHIMGLSSVPDNELDTTIGPIVESLQRIAAAYYSQGPTVPFSTHAVLQDRQRSMPPDVFVGPVEDRFWRNRGGDTGTVLVLSNKDAVFPDPDSVASVDPQSFIANVHKDSGCNQWVRLSPLRVDSVDVGYDNSLSLARFSTTDHGVPVRLFVLLTHAQAEHIDATTSCSLVVHTANPLVRTFREKLTETPFNDKTLSLQQVGQLLSEFSERAPEEAYPLFCLQHRDLHAGNLVATSNGRLKAIDLGDAGRDLRFTDVARLEFSLWRCILSQASLTEAELRTVLGSLETRDGRRTGSSSSGTIQVDSDWISRLLQGVRAAFRKAMSKVAPVRPIEEPLAYLVELLAQQKWAILPNGLPCPELSGALFRYWHQRLLGVVESAPPRSRAIALPRRESTRPEEYMVEMKDLWTNALRYRESPTEPRRADAYADEIIQTLERTRANLLRQPLQPLQRHVFEASVANAETVPHGLIDANPFDSPLHVVLAGPTGCGKSTLIDTFLLRRAAGRSDLLRIYIAPTRALAYQKHEELMAMCDRLPEFDGRIVVSTGEDDNNDPAIANGRFAIACMVYEKANILFSRQKHLLNRIAVVVVDEFHRIADLHRGPALELAVAKIAAYRRERRGAVYPKIVAITTETATFEPLKRFLNIDANFDPSGGALCYVTDHRPIAIRHTLVLPTRHANAPDSYVPISICTFAAGRVSGARCLDSGDLDRLRSQIREAERKRPSAVRRREPRISDQFLPLSRLLQERVGRWLESGYRALIFVPTKGAIENLADGLVTAAAEWEAQARKSGAHSRKPQRDLAVTTLEEIIARCVDDGDVRSHLKGWARKGIFVHHADLPREVRRGVEAYFHAQPGPFEFEVLLATETLSFGVNLAVTDVILLDHRFLKGTRGRKPPTQVPLDPCDYHNMLGRCGRLGLAGTDSVDVFVVYTEERDAYSDIVQRYYKGITQTGSQLFSEDDDASHLRNTEAKASLGIETTLRPEELSLPFVGAILDALRHLSLSNDRRARDMRFVQLEDLELFLARDTLFASQHSAASLSSAPKQEDASAPAKIGARSRSEKLRSEFLDAIRAVLPTLTRDHLSLVKRGSSSIQEYCITARGETIIDTGLDIATIAPLIELTRSTLAAWKAVVPPGENTSTIPVELLLLALLAQREHFRFYFRWLVELHEHEALRTEAEEAAIADHRAFIDEALCVALGALGVAAAEKIVPAVRRVLDEWRPLEQFDGVPRYDGARTDGVLRMYLAVLQWILGEPADTIRKTLKSTRVFTRDRRFVSGFEGFTEQVAWRVRALSRLLVTEKNPVPHSERDLFLLESQVRYGVPGDGVLLVFRDGLIRREINQLLRDGHSPSVVARHPHERHSAIPSEKWNQLVGSFFESLGKNLRELSHQWSLGGSDEGDYNSVLALWNAISEDSGAVFSRSISAWRTVHGNPQPSGLNEALHRNLGDLSGPLWASDMAGETSAAAVPDRGNRRPGGNVVQLGGEDRIGDERLSVVVEVRGPVTSWLVRQENSTDPYPPADSELTILGLDFLPDWRCSMDGNNWIQYPALIGSIQSKHVLVVVTPWLPSPIGELPGRVATAIESRNSGLGTTKFISVAAFLALCSMLKRNLLQGGFDDVWDFLLRPADRASTEVISATDLTQFLPIEMATLRESLVRHVEIV